MIKAVIFDLDDTLISEYEYIISGYKKISEILAKKYSVDEEILFKELIDLFKENSINVFNRLLNKCNIEYDKNTIMDLVKNYREHMPEIKFYDDVVPVLERLKSNGIKTGIISDGYAIAQRNKINVLKAQEWVDYIILTDEWGKDYWKPNPKAFEEMKNKCECDYAEMVYVGDNPQKDFYIGKITPIYTVRICRGKGVYENAQYLNEIQEKQRITSLYEILDLENVIKSN